MRAVPWGVAVFAALAISVVLALLPSVLSALIGSQLWQFCMLTVMLTPQWFMVHDDKVCEAVAMASSST